VSTYVALLEGGKREEPVEVRQTAPGVYEVRLRGEAHVVDAFQHDHGTLSLIVDTASYTATLDHRGASARVRVRGSVFPMELLDERRLRMRRAPRRLGAAGRLTVVARVPARIVKVLVKLGDAVSAGQALVVVDALQMENEMRSPKDGKVVELHVQEGQSVEADAKLCAVE
jgi:biotin carboxyl carrier protein